jgi:hypothetical protein
MPSGAPCALEEPAYDRHGDARRHALAGLQGAPDEARERLAGHVVHDEQDLVVRGDDVERLDDVRVPDAGRELRLVEEHRDEVRVAREVRVEPLDGDRA